MKQRKEGYVALIIFITRSAISKTESCVQISLVFAQVYLIGNFFDQGWWLFLSSKRWLLVLDDIRFFVVVSSTIGSGSLMLRGCHTVPCFVVFNVVLWSTRYFHLSNRYYLLSNGENWVLLLVKGLQPWRWQSPLWHRNARYVVSCKPCISRNVRQSRVLCANVRQWIFIQRNSVCFSCRIRSKVDRPVQQKPLLSLL